MKLLNFIKCGIIIWACYKSVLMSKPNIRETVVAMSNICTSINSDFKQSMVQHSEQFCIA